MLSGGERRRLQLVMVLATQPNLLILDEPTNDLDLDTLRSLEAFLDDWPGALVVASHDRAFLDRVADHVLAIDPGGGVRRVPGGVAGWLQERASAGRGTAGAGPRRTTPDRSSTARPSTATPSTATPSRNTISGARAPRTGGPSPSTVNRRLRETERAMAKAQQRVDTLAARLVGLTDHAELGAIGAELTDAQRELDGHETAWLELAALQDN